MNELPLIVENLTFQYRRRSEPAIEKINFSVQPGQVILIAGSSGCGKTTLMRCINGLIPHTYSGEMSGDIHLFGKSVTGMRLADISQTVGTLLQDPERQILGSYVMNEVAFGLESLGIPREEITPRVEKALDRLGILHLRDRETFGTSGGEKQKIALAGVLAMEPKILLLDEPLSSLDPASAQEALQAFRQLANEGIAVMIVEHRVEDVLSIHPDVFMYLDEGKMAYLGDTDGLMDAVDYRCIKLPAQVVLERARRDPAPVFVPAANSRSEVKTALVRFEGVHFRYSGDGPEVLKGLNFNINAGDVIAVLGHNGSGKTTMVKHALSLLKPTEGRVLLEGQDTRKMTVAQAAHTVGYVFQSPSQMLFAPTVREELSFGPKNLGFPAETIVQNVVWAIETVNLKGEMDMPPLALSFGQQKRISIAAILAMRSRILMMDEPTAGQDYWNYQAFMDAILQMPGFDAVIFITHDVDLAVIYANRILLVYSGEIVADGKPQEVLKDEKLLRSCRVLPTSLLKLNMEYLPKTGRFYRAETLAHIQS
ncbi:MAG: ABC transporter ATP-binding protein [Anaerolineales bacterium]|nr:ABC transporter ATP-binding protein [Anaerolineales bacterium]